MIITTLLTFLFAVLLWKIIAWIFYRRRIHGIFTKYNIPGPKPDFLYGNIKEFYSKTIPVETMTDWQNTYGKYYGYFLGQDPYLVVNDLEMLKEIFIKDFSSFPDRVRSVLDIEPFKSSLLYLREKRWKEVRSIMTPLFSSNKVKRLTCIVTKKVSNMMDVVDEHASKKESFDIYKTFQALTLDIIGESVLAMNVDCLKNHNDPFLIACHDFFRHANSPAIYLTLLFPFLELVFRFINNYLVSVKMTQVIVDNIVDVIKQRRKLNITGNNILQYLMDATEGKEAEKKTAKNLMTDQELISNIYILLLAGYETTSTALGFTIHELVKHQDIQERVHEEARDVLKDNDEVTYEMIQKLSYTEQVILESMRIHPPVALFVSRQCTRTAQLSGGLTIPAGIYVQAPVYNIHNDPEIWPEPKKFDPERFFPENRQNIPSMAFMPFGVGPRICIGEKLALMEAKLALAQLMLRYRIEPGEGFEDPLPVICPTVIVNPRDSISVRAVPRNTSLPST